METLIQTKLSPSDRRKLQAHCSLLLVLSATSKYHNSIIIADQLDAEASNGFLDSKSFENSLNHRLKLDYHNELVLASVLIFTSAQ